MVRPIRERSGTYSRTNFGENMLFLKLKYTSPAGMVGATGYLQADFFSGTGVYNYLDFTFYDKAGDALVSGYGEFTIY